MAGVGDGVDHARLPGRGRRRRASPSELWQDADGVVRGRTDAPDELVPALVRQASRSLSLDHDGTGWPAVGDARPGHRWPPARARLPAAGLLLLRVRGGDVVRHRPAHLAPPERGDQAPTWPTGWATVPRWPGRRCPAFPRPARLLELREARGPERGEGQAAARPRDARRSRGGWTRSSLRALPEAEALAQLQTLPGVGPFTANGVLYRGCGVADGLPGGDELGREVVEGPVRDRGRRRARTWSDSRRRGGRTGCGRSCCCGWRGPGAAGPRSAIGGSAARPDGRRGAREDRV